MIPTPPALSGTLPKSETRSLIATSILISDLGRAGEGSGVATSFKPVRMSL